MKFLLNTAFLASLALGVAKGKESHASDIDMEEDFAYWRDLVDTVDSFASTVTPTKSPTSSPVVNPTNAPIDPTLAPVVSTLDPTDVPVSSCQTIAEVLNSTPEFTTLASLIDAAGIDDILTEDNLTLFAPTNKAIGALSDDLVDTLLADTKLLQFILFGHVIPREEVLLSDLECEGGALSSLSMANSEQTVISCGTGMDSDGNDIVITFIAGESQLGVSPKVVGPDGKACNGIIQAIDGVIMAAIPIETDAPVATPTADPITATDSPIATPLAQTDAPVAPTPAPVAITIDPTEAPVALTEAPVAPTEAPVAPTEAPVAPTEAPVAPTEAPVATTEAPVAPTETPTAATPVIQAKLIPFALNGGAEFEDTTSYQYKALKQVEAQSGIDEFTDAKLTQYYVLYCIYFATNGVPNLITDADPRFDAIAFPTWLITNGWEETNVDPCEWYGIKCDSEGRVSIIDLFENLLTGSFPPEVVLLSLDGPFSTGGGNLYRIDLFRNEFLYNNADSSWMTDLGSNMTTIIAEETAFTGDIPRLPDFLVNFDVSFAFFTGGLSDENFENLEKLNFIDLDGNAFNSTIPSVFGRLPSLGFLYLSDSFLSGDLSYMNGMTSIREHWIDTNPGLKGPIFEFIGDLTTLESWSMTFNSVTGTLPSSLGNLSNMKQMWLYSNELTGTIPTELANNRDLRILQLEGNSFTGSMPVEICANTVFPTQIIETLGADCEDDNFECSCCTCCSVLECTN